MKNNIGFPIFILIITLFYGMDSFALKPQKDIAIKRRTYNPQSGFQAIMQKPWSNRMQVEITFGWRNWNPGQKQAILQRLCDQGLLSQSEVDNWPMSQRPMLQ